ncbi:MAG: hypothetical protein ABL961_12495 [Vicinamibacterales bacterium]
MMERCGVGLTAAAVLVGLTLCAAASHAAQQTSGDAALHLRVAMKAVDEGEFEVALDEVREAAKLAPTDPVIQFAMATILDKREKVDEALAALDKAQTLGLPEAYREKADDLRVTLLYKQKKNLKAPPTGAAPGDSSQSRNFSSQSRNFKINDSSVVDLVSGLEWSLRDNGSPITQQAAYRYCAALPPGNWRLPSHDDLNALIRSVREQPLQISRNGHPLQSAPGMQLSSAFFWSTLAGIPFNFRASGPAVLRGNFSQDVRALCVR